MQKIKETLERLFQKHRLIFWYDNDSALKEDFENLEIENVKKLILDNNEFGIKYKVLKENPDDKFLIYSPKPKPDDEINLLLDLNLSNHIFDADKSSIIAAELDMDISLKPIIKEHIQFFNSKKRVEKLKNFQIKTKEDLLNGMIAVVLNTEIDIESFLFVLFKEFSENNDVKYSELKRFGLEKYFFNLLNQKYGYHGESLKEFLIELFETHFYFHINKNKIPLNREAFLFVSKWMDSSKNRESFEILAKEVGEEIGLLNKIQQYNIQELINTDTYKEIDFKIIYQLINKLLDENVNFDELLEIIDNRKRLFWFKEFENIYNAIYFAIKFLQFFANRDFKIENIEDGFKKYIKKWHKGDYYYRKFIYYQENAEDNNILKKLKKAIENLYVKFQRKLNEQWQIQIDKLNKFKIDNVPYQIDFFKRFVIPNFDKRVFIIISDALRYEAGVELFENLNKNNRFNVTIDAMYSAIPSITQIGIAALLPHKKIEFKDGKTVLVDNISNDNIENRKKIIKNYLKEEPGTYITSDEFLNLKKDEGREFVKKNQLIYIYHNDIDSISDHALSENNCVFSVEKAIATLEKIVKQIFNFNGNFVIITSDHGFLYQEEKLSDIDFCELPKLGEIKVKNKRFVIGKNLFEDKNVKKFYLKDCEIDSEDEILIPKSIIRFKTQGGGNKFVHGGLSLQEITIPVILCKRLRKDDIKKVEVDIIKSIYRITSNNVPVTLIQRTPVKDKIISRELKIGFYSKDGELLSNVEKVVFNREDTDSRNLEYKLKFILSDKVINLQGQNIYLRLEEQIEGTNKYKIYKEEPFEVFISFINEFDDF